MAITFAITPSPRAYGEKAGMRGSCVCRSKLLPLTLTLSPSKEWGEGMRVETSELNSIFTLDVRKGGELFPPPCGEGGA